MERGLTELVESISRRRVRACMSANHVQPDLTCKVVLEPAPRAKRFGSARV